MGLAQNKRLEIHTADAPHAARVHKAQEWDVLHERRALQHEVVNGEHQHDQRRDVLHEDCPAQISGTDKAPASFAHTYTHTDTSASVRVEPKHMRRPSSDKGLRPDRQPGTCT